MKKIFIVFAALIACLFTTGMLFAADGDFKNNLLKVELSKTGEDSYNINLYTKKVYTEPVKVVKKTDTVYYFLLPETSNSVTSVTPNGAITNVLIKTYPYAGQDDKNGYTKVAIITSKPVNITTTTKAADTSISPKLDPMRLARLDSVFEKYSEKLAANNIPTPLAEFRKNKTTAQTQTIAQNVQPAKNTAEIQTQKTQTQNTAQQNTKTTSVNPQKTQTNPIQKLASSNTASTKTNVENQTQKTTSTGVSQTKTTNTENKADTKKTSADVQKANVQSEAQKTAAQNKTALQNTSSNNVKKAADNTKQTKQTQTNVQKTANANVQKTNVQQTQKSASASNKTSSNVKNVQTSQNTAKTTDEKRLNAPKTVQTKQDTQKTTALANQADNIKEDIKPVENEVKKDENELLAEARGTDSEGEENDIQDSGNEKNITVEIPTERNNYPKTADEDNNQTILYALIAAGLSIFAVFAILQLKKRHKLRLAGANANRSEISKEDIKEMLKQRAAGQQNRIEALQNGANGQAQPQMRQNTAPIRPQTRQASVPNIQNVQNIQKAMPQNTLYANNQGNSGLNIPKNNVSPIQKINSGDTYSTVTPLRGEAPSAAYNNASNVNSYGGQLQNNNNAGARVYEASPVNNSPSVEPEQKIAYTDRYSTLDDEISFENLPVEDNEPDTTPDFNDTYKATVEENIEPEEILQPEVEEDGEEISAIFKAFNEKLDNLQSENVNFEDEDSMLEELLTPIDSTYSDDNVVANYEDNFSDKDENEDFATIVSSSKLTETRGLYLAKFEGTTSLIGYIQDDVYVLYNFGDGEVKDTDIESRLAKENDTDSLYIVKTGGKEFVVKSTPYDMSLEKVAA